MKVTKRQIRRIIKESLLVETTSHERETGLPSEFVEDNWLPWLAERGLSVEDLDDLAQFTGAPDRSWLSAAPPADGMDGPADLELWARNKRSSIKEGKMKITKQKLRKIIQESILNEGPRRVAGLKDLFAEFGVARKDHKLMKDMVEEWYHNEGGFFHGPHQSAQMRFEDQMGPDVFEDLMVKGSKLYRVAWRKWDARQFDLNKYR